jgi:uncharacterized membrane protein
MGNDPFGARQALMEMAVAALLISFCLHWAAILIAQVWPWLLLIAATVGAIRLAIVWVRWRNSGW